MQYIIETILSSYANSEWRTSKEILMRWKCVNWCAVVAQPYTIFPKTSIYYGLRLSHNCVLTCKDCYRFREIFTRPFY